MEECKHNEFRVVKNIPLPTLDQGIIFIHRLYCDECKTVLKRLKCNNERM